MKYLKTLGVVAVAAMALMAVIGAGTASATVLCKNNTTTPCSEKYASGTAISAKLVAGTKAVLKGPLPVECSKSTVSGKTTAESGAPLPGEITGLTFTECTTCPTVTAEALPYKASVEATSGGNGTMTVGKPRVKLSGCFGFLTCIASAESVVLDVTGGTPAKVKAVEEPIKLEGGGCGEKGTWNAEYEVTSPSPLFVRAS